MNKSARSVYVIGVLPVLLALYEFALYLSNDAYLPALPSIMRDFGVGSHALQLTITSWFLGSASLQLVLGPVCQRYGRRSVLLLGGAAFVLSSLGCGYSTEIWPLLIFRFVQGATIGTMVVAGYATIHDLYNQKEAIQAIAVMNSINVLAPSLGPLFGALMLHVMRWHYIFIVLAFWATIAIVGLYIKMPETARHANTAISFKQAVQQYWRIVTNRQYMRPLLTSNCIFAVLIVWIAVGPFLLMGQFHFTVLYYGFVQTLIFLCYIVVSRCVKYVIHVFNLRYLIVAGLSLLLVAAVYSCVLALHWPYLVWGIISAMMLVSAACGLLFPILGRMAIEGSDEPMESRVALQSFFTCIAAVIASGLASGFAIQTIQPLAILLLVFVVLALLCYGLMGARAVLVV
ncbi:MAG: MFS transporter [Coxiellaceae bacterium]|nr:MFS transporter [Coxiellaceae bacterium]